MKKTALLLVLCVLLSLCSCIVKNTEPEKDIPSKSEISSSNNDTSDVKSDTVSSKTETTADYEKIARELFDRNLKCMLDIYELRYLPHEETPIKEYIYPVKDDEFKTFADLEEFTKSTYVKEVSDRLLYGKRFEDYVLYSEVDGVFCIDEMATGGKGYHVNWTDYKITDINHTENELTFKVNAVITEPSDNPVEEPYVREAKAQNTDGKWLLTATIV